MSNFTSLFHTQFLRCFLYANSSDEISTIYFNWSLASGWAFAQEEYVWDYFGGIVQEKIIIKKKVEKPSEVWVIIAEIWCVFCHINISQKII